LKEGAWVNIATGRFEWISEHCDWMKVRENAKRIGLPDSVSEVIESIPNDYSGPKREKLLRAVMDAGFVRVRGHGSFITIEFTASTETALRACRNFLQQVCGPLTVLRFNHLGGSEDETIELTYEQFDDRMKRHTF